MSSSHNWVDFGISCLGGGIAGLVVDVSLFPLDTIKTRMQSAHGFRKSGGFNGVYRGLSIAAVGSVPGAAVFFSTYDTSKKMLANSAPQLPEPVRHMGAASIAEVMACLIRVPTEVIKQRMQTGAGNHALDVIRAVLKTSGFKGLYTGFYATVSREIPFSLIQFPLYEMMKVSLKRKIYHSDEGPIPPYVGAICGSLSGGLAAGLTTPLDVVKTRLMLGADVNGKVYSGILNTLSRVYAEGGVGLCFAGVEPRIMWISIGGFFFFGAYEGSTGILRSLLM
jgi:solute carrier family 25 S-adenosylmethionine transporter 26